MEKIPGSGFHWSTDISILMFPPADTNHASLFNGICFPSDVIAVITARKSSSSPAVSSQVPMVPSRVLLPKFCNDCEVSVHVDEASGYALDMSYNERFPSFVPFVYWTLNSPLLVGCSNTRWLFCSTKSSDDVNAHAVSLAPNSETDRSMPIYASTTGD